MIIYLNEHNLRIDSVYEHVDRNQLVASCKVAKGEEFPDISFMKDLKHLDSFSLTDDEGAELPLVCDYNYVDSFTTSFSPTISNYSMCLTCVE